MDCRISLRARRILLALLRPALPTGCLMLALASGCQLQHQQLVKTADGQTVALENKSEKPEEKRPPKPQSLVSFGDFRRQHANNEQNRPAMADALRDEARRAYQQAIELDPNCLEAYTGLATLYQDMSEYDRAVATYDKVLKLQPKSPELWFRFGMCQARQKEYDRACESLKTATQLDPENKRYLNSLGFCLGRAGRFEESYTCFLREMGEAKAHYNVARMLHHVKREAECRQHLELALKANPQYQDARTLLAQVENADGTSKDVVPASFEVKGDAGKK